MPNTFTTTSTQGFGSRIMNSFVGLLLGPVLVVGAIFVLTTLAADTLYTMLNPRLWDGAA